MNDLSHYDLESQKLFHKLRREDKVRARTVELGIIVQPQPIETTENNERSVIESTGPNPTNMNRAIIKPDITSHFELK